VTERLPYDELTEHTLPALLRVLGERHGDREAVVAPEGRVSYAELLARCAEMAGYYAEAGLAPGERVGVLLPNGLRWLVATLGAQLAGLTAVPVNTWYRSAEYAHVIATAGLRLLVTEEKLFGRAVLDDLAEAGYPGRFDASRPGTSPGAGYRGALLWPAEAPRAPGVTAGATGPDVTVRPEDTALVLFTSGSTAVPKTVPLRHGGLVRNSRAMGERQHLVPGDRLWFALPMFFGYGCANALPVALDHAVTLCLQERVDGEAALEFIERERCTVYYGLGPANHLLRAAPSFGRRDISSLRTGTTGMSAEDKRVAIEELGVHQVCSVYGLTEAYGHSTMTDALDPLEVKLHTVGRILPTQEIRIVDEQGEPRPRGETGEVQLRGCVIDGYLNMPEVDATSFHDGWFRTGDLGFLDERDFLHFVGRSKEMIKVSGINIAPAEVEDVLGGHPAIEQVHVVGASDGAGGELIVAFVVPRSADADPDGLTEALTKHIRARAASYKVPGRFMPLAAEDIPLTATGKVSKLKLRELAERNLGARQ
jgi:HIP---CoA ligase